MREQKDHHQNDHDESLGFHPYGNKNVINKDLQNVSNFNDKENISNFKEPGSDLAVKDQNSSESAASKSENFQHETWGTLYCFPSPSSKDSKKSHSKCFSIHLSKPEYTIGRSPKSDIVNSNLKVSGTHMKLKNVGGVAVLVDMSLNGTFVDGKLIKGKAAPLTDGSEIFLETDHYFVFMYPEGILPLVKNIYYIFKSKELGRGTFAQVYLSIDKLGNRLACKAIDIRGSALEQTSYERIVQEVTLLSSVQHPNIVSISDWAADDKKVYLFLSRVRGGELFDRIVGDDGMNESEVKFIFYQILRAVQYLHRKNICHRDIKAENILLDSKLPFSRALLADFGMSKIADNLKTKCGTANYLAPEVMDSPLGYTKQVDCWSLGVLLYTMIQGNLPFRPMYRNGAEVEGSLLESIRRGQIDFTDDKWKKTSRELRSVIRNFLNVDPIERMSVEEAFAHPWIADSLDILKKLYCKMLVRAGYL